MDVVEGLAPAVQHRGAGWRETAVACCSRQARHDATILHKGRRAGIRCASHERQHCAGSGHDIQEGDASSDWSRRPGVGLGDRHIGWLVPAKKAALRPRTAGTVAQARSRQSRPSSLALPPAWWLLQCSFTLTLDIGTVLGVRHAALFGWNRCRTGQVLNGNSCEEQSLFRPRCAAARKHSPCFCA